MYNKTYQSGKFGKSIADKLSQDKSPPKRSQGGMLDSTDRATMANYDSSASQMIPNEEEGAAEINMIYKLNNNKQFYGMNDRSKNMKEKPMQTRS